MMQRSTSLFVILALGLVASTAMAQQAQPAQPTRHPSVPEYDEPQFVRIKDIATVEGVRSNFLKGLGLVVGLNGTGDSPKALERSYISKALKLYFGQQVSPTDIESKNVAVVLVTADLPPFCEVGAKFDVQVSSFGGDAKSLRGGILLETPLLGPGALDKDTPDYDRTFALAQGPLSIGPPTAHPTVGSIPNGAILEKEVVTDFTAGNSFCLVLNRPDFNHAREVAIAINESAGEFGLPVREQLDIARPESASRIAVTIPKEYREKNVPGRTTVDFIALVLGLQMRNLLPSTEAVVVIDEKTLTVGIHGHATVSPTIVITKGVRLHIPDNPQLGSGKSAVGTYSLRDIIGRLDAVGVDAATIIEMVKSLHAQGVLRAKLIMK